MKPTEKQSSESTSHRTRTQPQPDISAYPGLQFAVRDMNLELPAEIDPVSLYELEEEIQAAFRASRAAYLAIMAEHRVAKEMTAMLERKGVKFL